MIKLLSSVLCLEEVGEQDKISSTGRSSEE